MNDLEDDEDWRELVGKVEFILRGLKDLRQRVKKNASLMARLNRVIDNLEVWLEAAK